MKTLESLVPPLDLCKLIPKGQFADSALVYGNPKGWSPCLYPKLVTRDECSDPDKIIAPAPTLAEILDKLDYYTTIQRDSSDLYYPSYSKYDDDDFLDPNPATAALKLWLELNKENKEKNITLTEAIKHCREVADRNCGKCADDHRQLAKWLEELKKLRHIKRKKSENEH